MFSNRSIMRIVVWMLALLFTGSSSLPSPWLWRCRHASRLVAAPFAAAEAMPCGMLPGSMSSGNMACCRHHLQTLSNSSTKTVIMGAPACRPSFVKMASMPPAAQNDEQIRHRAPTGATASLPYVASYAPLTFAPITLKQRPPPSCHLSRLASLTTAGLRAPPPLA